MLNASCIRALSTNVQGIRDKNKKLYYKMLQKYESGHNIPWKYWVRWYQQEVRELWGGEVLVSGSTIIARSIAVLFGSNFGKLLFLAFRRDYTLT